MTRINNLLASYKIKRGQIAFCFGVILPILLDITLFIGDYLFGIERGVLFSYKVLDLILVSNTVISSFAILYFAFPYLLIIQQKTWRTLSNSYKHVPITVIFIVVIDILLLVIYSIAGNAKLFGIELLSFILVANLLIIGVVILFLLYFKIRIYLNLLLSKFKSTYKAVLLSLTSLIIFIVLIEILFYFLLLHRTNSFPEFAEIVKPNFYNTDSLLGIKGMPNLNSVHQKFVIDRSTHDSTKLFSVRVTTDQYGYRTVDIPNMQKRKMYALFMGCSFTFGTGVNDDETISSFFAKKDTSYCSYNMGFGGWGPQNSLAKLQFGELEKIVTQDSGICIYTYIADHVPRAIGDMKCYNGWARDFPYYDYKNDSLQYLGSFSHDRGLTSDFYSFIWKSNFIKYFNINFPLAKTDQHYKLTCDIIYHASLEYKRKFKNDNFYVMIYPNQDDIQKYLKDYDVKILDLSKVLEKGNWQDYFIEYDGHPTSVANDRLTDRLVKVIDSLGQSKLKILAHKTE